MRASVLLFLLNLLSIAAYARIDHVVIVSMDGGGSVVVENAASPVIRSFIDEGASTFDARTVSPSVTLPSHASMLTGVSPEKHKITWNTWKPKKGVVGVPTVFSLAKEAGFSTAFFGAKEKFKHLLIEDSIDKFVIVSGSAKSISKEASDYFKSSRPNLMFVHLPDLDSQGHKKGWGSKEQSVALKNVDDALRSLKENIVSAVGEKSFLLIITADHGGKKKTHGSSEDSSSRIPWIVWGTGVAKGLKFIGEVSTIDTTPTVLDQLGINVDSEIEGKSLSLLFME